MTNPAHKLPVTLSTHTGDPANDTHDAPVFLLPALPLDGSITLATLAALFPTADAGCRAIHLRNHREADLVNEGNKVATPRILDAVPRLLVSVLRALARVTPAQADCIVIDTEILGVIVQESVKLADLHARFLASAPARSVRRASHDVVQRERHSAAVSERDLVRRGLAQVLGAAAVPELAPAQDASTDAALASGLTHLADLIDRTLAHGTPDEREQLARRRLAAPRATSLRAHAHALHATSTAATAAPPPRAVTQRELDHQDGVVLVLLDALVDGMLEAHRASPSIEKPDFATLTKRYRSRSGKRRAKGEAGGEG